MAERQCGGRVDSSAVRRPMSVHNREKETAKRGLVGTFWVAPTTGARPYQGYRPNVNSVTVCLVLD